MKKMLLLALGSGIVCQAFAQQIALRETTPKPEGVLHLKTAQLPDGDILVFGGTANIPTTLTTSWRYDWQTETWSEAAPLAFPVAQMAIATLSNGDILCVGGTDNFSGKVQKSQRYRISTGQWTASAGDFDSFNPIYTGHSVLTLPGDYVLLTTTNGDLAIYDPVNDNWTPIFPGPLDAGGRPMYWIASQSEVFLTGAGGQIFVPANSPFGGSLTYLDPPQPLFTSATVQLPDERVVTMNLASNFDNELSIYDPATKTATVVSEVPFNGGSASRNAILMADGRVLTFGFGDITSPGDTKLVQVYDPAANTWGVGTYSGLGSLGFPSLHLLPDSSIFAIDGTPENFGLEKKNRCWIINRNTSSAANETVQPRPRLYPNPATDYLLLTESGNENVSLSLYFPDGRQAGHWPKASGTVSLAERRLPAGIYYYRVAKSDGIPLISGKLFLKNH